MQEPPEYHSYDRWQYAWSTNCSTTPSASRGGPHRNRTHAAPCASLTPTVPRRPVRRPTTAAPRALPRATGDTSHAAASRGPGAAARGPYRPRAPAPLSRPSPRPQIDQRRVRARRAVEGVHAAQHARCRRKRAQPARLVVLIHMLHKFVPQLRAQVRPHLPGEARARGAHKRAPALRSAPPREARERGRGGRGAGGGF